MRTLLVQWRSCADRKTEGGGAYQGGHSSDKGRRELTFLDFVWTSFWTIPYCKAMQWLFLKIIKLSVTSLHVAFIILICF